MHRQGDAAAGDCTPQTSAPGKGATAHCLPSHCLLLTSHLLSFSHLLTSYNNNVPLLSLGSMHRGGKNTAKEDAVRVARGEPPQKRTTKYHYAYKECGKAKSKTNGHTQLKDEVV